MLRELQTKNEFLQKQLDEISSKIAAINNKHKEEIDKLERLFGGGPSKINSNRSSQKSIASSSTKALNSKSETFRSSSSKFVKK